MSTENPNYQNHCADVGHHSCIQLHREDHPLTWWLQMLIGGVCACAAGPGFHRSR
jgi:hypothetical protein